MCVHLECFIYNLYILIFNLLHYIIIVYVQCIKIIIINFMSAEFYKMSALKHIHMVKLLRRQFTINLFLHIYYVYFNIKN